jgi:hypothetical protein
VRTGPDVDIRVDERSLPAAELDELVSFEGKGVVGHRMSPFQRRTYRLRTDSHV